MGPLLAAKNTAEAGARLAVYGWLNRHPQVGQTKGFASHDWASVQQAEEFMHYFDEFLLNRGFKATQSVPTPRGPQVLANPTSRGYELGDEHGKPLYVIMRVEKDSRGTPQTELSTSWLIKGDLDAQNTLESRARAFSEVAKAAVEQFRTQQAGGA